jgi:hypothetical protein
MDIGKQQNTHIELLCDSVFSPRLEFLRLSGLTDANAEGFSVRLNLSDDPFTAAVSCGAAVGDPVGGSLQGGIEVDVTMQLIPGLERFDFAECFQGGFCAPF